MFLTKLINSLDEYHLLKHPFYQKWNEGGLNLEILQYYAEQYFKNIDAFPRYVSGVHSLCPSIGDRKILLENLIDEERGTEDHPELWLRFAESLGKTRAEVKSAIATEATQKLVDGFLALVKESYATGLGALFAYEQQVPAIAQSKIDGLKNFYGYDDNNPGLAFFKVHVKADELHSNECANLLDKLSLEGQKFAYEGAIKAAKLLWGFLDSVYDEFQKGLTGSNHGSYC